MNTLIDRIERLMQTDDEPRAKSERYLLAAQRRAKAVDAELSKAGLEYTTTTQVLDDAFIALCGYSLTSLLEDPSLGAE